MKLYRVILPVTDITLATEFYSGLFRRPGSLVSPGRRYFDCEGTLLACYDAIADGDPVHAGPLPEHLYFAVNDLEDAYARCKSLGAVFPKDILPDIGPLGEICCRPWGERSFYIRDPFNNPLCLVDQDSVLSPSDTGMFVRPDQARSPTRASDA